MVGQNEQVMSLRQIKMLLKYDNFGAKNGE
jgi:hypothetical protein